MITYYEILSVTKGIIELINKANTGRILQKAYIRIPRIHVCMFPK